MAAYTPPPSETLLPGDPVFSFFLANCLKFVRQEKYTTDLANEDSRLSNDLTYPYTRNKQLWAKFNRTDDPFFQFRTNYSSFNVMLYDEAGNALNKNSWLELVYTASDGRKQYQVNIDCSSLDGLYYFVVTTKDSGKPLANFQSEWFEVKESHTNTLQLKWRTSDTNGVIYDTRYNYIQVNAKLLKYEAGSIKTVNTDSTGSERLLRGIVQKTKILEFDEQPGWIVELINCIFTHEYIHVNGVRYATNDKLEATNIDGTNTFIPQIKLTQVGYNDVTVDEVLTGDYPPEVTANLLINATDKLLINDIDNLRTQ